MNSSRERRDVTPLYDITSRSYDSLYREEQFRKYKFIFETRGVTPGKTILDLGCGTGLLIEYLMDRGYEFDKYICVEPSIGMISVIIDKGFGKLCRVSIIRSYGEYLPLKDGTVDSAFLFTVWNNLIDPDKVLKELGRVVKNNGYIIVSVMRREGTEQDSSIMMRHFRIVDLGCVDKECFYMLMSKNI